MDHLTIPIPEGLDDRQKADLIGWLAEQAQEVVGKRLPLEADPAFHAEAIARIKRGMADVDAGRTITSEPKFGFGSTSRPRRGRGM